MVTIIPKQRRRTTGIYLSDDMFERLTAIARANGVSRNECIRQILESGLKVMEAADGE